MLTFLCRVRSPTSYLQTYWRTQVSKHHLPIYSLVSRVAPPAGTLYGATLTLLFPPSSTRTYTVDSVYASKKEAKDAVSSLAMRNGVLEKGKQARDAAGEEGDVPTVSKDGGDAWETLENPVGALHQAFQKYMPCDMFSFEFKSVENGESASWSLVAAAC